MQNLLEGKIARSIKLGVQAGIIGLFTTMISTSVMASEWMEDPITSCKVMTSELDKNETISWSGDCLDGKASGPGDLDIFEDGQLIARYQGRMEQGAATGFGNLWYKIGDDYDHYEGEFENDEIHGSGIYTAANGNHYEGEFRNNLPDGTGIFTGTNGDSYFGELKKGDPDGKGNQTTANGDQYSGEFVQGKRQGHGTLMSTEGYTYEGEFQNDLPNGKGVAVTSTGAKYEGEVKDGNASGKGKFTDIDGTVYEGSWTDNKLEGKVMVTSADGRKKQQTFSKGEPVQ